VLLYAGFATPGALRITEILRYHIRTYGELITVFPCEIFTAKNGEPGLPARSGLVLAA
jgi:hypothetical protein